MATFPGAKVKRPNRRKLGRGQSIPRGSANATVTNVTSVVTLAFDVPVIVSGDIDLSIAGVTLTSQTQDDSQTVTQHYSGTVAAKPWTLQDNDVAIRTFQGGGVVGDSGTFP